MGTLEKFYAAIKENNSYFNMYIPESDIIYSKAALEQKFSRDFTVDEVIHLLSSEGLLSPDA